MVEVYCISCGVVRMAEQDLIASEREAKKTTKEPCECGCPFVMEKFDKRGVCYKCGGRVSRLESGTWHHDDIQDYNNCGFVKVKRDVNKLLGIEFIEMPKDRKDLDGSEDFSLVNIKDGRPYCKVHGAMNKVSKNIWRCITQYGRTKEGKFVDRVCNACCLETSDKETNTR